MEWITDYQHGIIWQDFQHKQLVDKMNELLNTIISGHNKEAFFETVRFVKEYSTNHFKTEELYMKNWGYPKFKEHSLEHQGFITDFNHHITNCIYLESESSGELINKLTKWFFNHTQTSDKELANFLLKKGVRT
jgi:hemerythrin-like metal-binding protein